MTSGYTVNPKILTFSADKSVEKVLITNHTENLVRFQVLQNPAYYVHETSGRLEPNTSKTLIFKLVTSCSSTLLPVNPVIIVLRKADRTDEIISIPFQWTTETTGERGKLIKGFDDDEFELQKIEIDRKKKIHKEHMQRANNLEKIKSLVKQREQLLIQLSKILVLLIIITVFLFISLLISGCSYLLGLSL